MGNLLKTLSFLSLRRAVCHRAVYLSTLAGALAVGALSFSTLSHAKSNHTFTTELQEVRTGSINGKVFLDVYISSSVGPSNCQGSVLRVDTQSVSQPGRQGVMESVALEAMLTSKPVIITVPMTWNECVDGMPTMTYINLLNHAQ